MKKEVKTKEAVKQWVDLCLELIIYKKKQNGNEKTYEKLKK